MQDPRKYFDPGPAHAGGGGDRGSEGRSPEAAAAAFLRHVADAKVYRIQDPVMPLAAAESVRGRGGDSKGGGERGKRNMFGYGARWQSYVCKTTTKK